MTKIEPAVMVRTVSSRNPNPGFGTTGTENWLFMLSRKIAIPKDCTIESNTVP